MHLEGEVAELRRELANFRLEADSEIAGEEADDQPGSEAVRKRLGRICSAKAGGNHGCLFKQLFVVHWWGLGFGTLTSYSILLFPLYFPHVRMRARAAKKLRMSPPGHVHQQSDSRDRESPEREDENESPVDVGRQAA